MNAVFSRKRTNYNIFIYLHFIVIFYRAKRFAVVKNDYIFCIYEKNTFFVGRALVFGLNSYSFDIYKLNAGCAVRTLRCLWSAPCALSVEFFIVEF